ncbi:MAG: hypothetical protein DWQ49_09885 [Bacteroidetes bacterium]|nr:MAG: hypothetical protein DWQ49_09885 [Bacteroidota bacterium]
MISLFTSLLPGLFKIGDKLIEDKDKKIEYAFKVQEMAFKQMEILINAKTYPWVDAFVKLAYSAEAIIKGLFRPIISCILTGIAIYVEFKGIHMSDTLHTILMAAFPAWMVDRGLDKRRKKHEDSDIGW